VDSIIIHPAYDRNSFNADIALLRLKQKVTFTRAIRPVCLPIKGIVFLCIKTMYSTLNQMCGKVSITPSMPILLCLGLNRKSLLLELLDRCVCLLKVKFLCLFKQCYLLSIQLCSKVSITPLMPL